jgi:hypothetical protein
MITNPSTPTQTKSDCPFKDFAVSKFIRFLKHIGLKKLLTQIPDARNQNKITYPNHSLLLWALSVFFFRQESKNALSTTISDLSIQQQDSFLQYLEIESSSLPKRDCVDDYLSTIDSESINDLMMHIFHWAKINKLFYNHAETILPYDSFHLGIDGFWVHRYSKPHATNECGENTCPYCLPRVHNKGKEDEKTDWLHAFVTFMLIFPGGFQFPIYVYPLKASQVDATATDKKLKQECELLAIHKVLPELRKKLGRVAITVLLDSLYANEPVFALLELLGLSYLIVRQEDSFNSIGGKCDELDKCELYQKNYRDKKVESRSENQTVEKTAKWFNHVACGKESFVNVLRFSEVTKDTNGNIITDFHTEWLSNIPIKKTNWLNLSQRGRMRGDHEDMHNTLKNRGFAATHDYARSDPNLSLVWKLLMFAAMLILELFSFTTIAQVAKGKRSWMKFFKDLLQQLVEISWNDISSSLILQKAKVQFRFDFAPE